MNMWAVAAGTGAALILNEYCGISPWAARKLVVWSAHLRYTDLDRAEMRAEEFAALIDKRPVKLFKLITALTFAVSATRVAAVRRVERALTFNANSSSGSRARLSSSGTIVLATSVTSAFIAATAASIAILISMNHGAPNASFMQTPNQLDSFLRKPALEQQMNVGQLRQDVVKTSDGQANHVVEAVYETGSSPSNSTPQIFLFIGGNLVNAAPTVSVASFIERFRGAKAVSLGQLPGKAACIDASASEPGSVAMCAWFDSDAFGEMVSPTMSATTLAKELRQLRPEIEHWKRSS